MSALVEPNPQPQAAVMHDGGPLLVFGGAGKVPTLAARVAGPARRHGADAQDLIAIARLSLGCTKTHARVPHFRAQFGPPATVRAPQHQVRQVRRAELPGFGHVTDVLALLPWADNPKSRLARLHGAMDVAADPAAARQSHQSLWCALHVSPGRHLERLHDDAPARRADLDALAALSPRKAAASAFSPTERCRRLPARRPGRRQRGRAR